MHALDPDYLAFHTHRLGVLEGERRSWEDHWRKLAEVFTERTATSLRRNLAGGQEGSRLNEGRLDSTGADALALLVAGMSTGVSSPAREWFDLQPANPELREEFGETRDWVDSLKRVVYDVLRETNFYRVAPMVYHDCALYGTACMYRTRFTTEEGEPSIRWGLFPIGTYACAENEAGDVRVVYVRTELTVQQCWQRYSRQWSRLSERTQRAAKDGKWDDRVSFIEVFEPNPHGPLAPSYSAPGPGIPPEGRYRHVVFEDAGQEKAAEQTRPITEAFFDTFPVRVIRWWLHPGEVWGRSPAMEVLGDCLQLQRQQEEKASALAKFVNPPMAAPSEMESRIISTLPGGVSYVGGVGGAVEKMITPLFHPDPNLQHFVLDMEDVRGRIRKGMYSDLFRMITDRPGVQPLQNAEVAERREEKFLALGSVMNRLHHEMLRPSVEDAMNFALQMGLVEPQPEEIQGQRLDVEPLSTIDLAQRSQALEPIRNVAEFAALLGQAQATVGEQPTALDLLDIDKAVSAFATARGVPASVVRSPVEVEDVRRAREEAIAAQMQAQVAKDAATAEKTRAEAQQIAPDTQPEPVQ